MKQLMLLENLLRAESSASNCSFPETILSAHVQMHPGASTVLRDKGQSLIDKHHVIWAHDGLLFNLKKEGGFDISGNMDGP